MTRTFDYEGGKMSAPPSAVVIDSGLAIALERYIDVIQPSSAAVKSEHKKKKKTVSE
jgi:membrane protein involved in colicin uptake